MAAVLGGPAEKTSRLFSFLCLLQKLNQIHDIKATVKFTGVIKAFNSENKSLALSHVVKERDLGHFPESVQWAP